MIARVIRCSLIAGQYTGCHNIIKFSIVLQLNGHKDCASWNWIVEHVIDIDLC